MSIVVSLVILGGVVEFLPTPSVGLTVSPDLPAADITVSCEDKSSSICSSAMSEKEAQPYHVPNGNVYPLIRDGSVWAPRFPFEEFHFSPVRTPELEKRLQEKQSFDNARWNIECGRTIKQNVENGVVIVALSNLAMKEMTMNWIASLQRNNFKRFVVLCFDFAMYRFLSEYGYENNAAMIPQDWTQADIPDQACNDMQQDKVRICLQLFQRGFTVLYNDVNLVFLSPDVVKHLLAEDEGVNADFIYMLEDSVEAHISTFHDLNL